jgi:transcriptional regulator with XRE-family HTH domain
MSRSAHRPGIGGRLLATRKRKGLTQVQLSQLSGVGQPAISSLETGDSQNPMSDTLIALARALDVDPAWLESGKAPQKQDEVGRWLALLDSLTTENRAALYAAGDAMLKTQRKPSAADPFPGVPMPASRPVKRDT